MALFSIAQIAQMAFISSAYKLAETINLSVQKLIIDVIFLNSIIGYFSCKNFEIIHPHQSPFLSQKCHQHNN